MTDKPPVIVPERRGDRAHRLWSALPELLIAIASLLAGMAYLANPASYALTAIGMLPALPRGLWLVTLIVGAIATLAGHRSDRQQVARLGLCLLSLADLAYAACLLPSRGGQASLTTLMLMANGVYLMARANRWGRA